LDESDANLLGKDAGPVEGPKVRSVGEAAVLKRGRSCEAGKAARRDKEMSQRLPGEVSAD
jgi:hypothetical protein